MSPLGALSNQTGNQCLSVFSLIVAQSTGASPSLDATLAGVLLYFNCSPGGHHPRGLQTIGWPLHSPLLCPVRLIRYPAPSTFTLAQRHLFFWTLVLACLRFSPALVCAAATALLSQSGSIWSFPLLQGPSHFELDQYHRKQ